MDTTDAVEDNANIIRSSTPPRATRPDVADMFNSIASHYDFLNHFLSMGIDKGWRKKAIAEVASSRPVAILDVATGTADMAIAAACSISAAKITGVDIAQQMLAEGVKKIDERKLGNRIDLRLADSKQLPFADATFDVVMCAYGVRNFDQLESGLKEMNRVLRPGGRAVILEFSHPSRFPIRQLYQFYFRRIVPIIGKLVSKSTFAYTYLPDSVSKFPQGRDFCQILTKCGFIEAKSRPLTLGITCLYTAKK